MHGLFGHGDGLTLAMSGLIFAMTGLTFAIGHGDGLSFAMIPDLRRF